MLVNVSSITFNVSKIFNVSSISYSGRISGHTNSFRRYLASETSEARGRGGGKPAKLAQPAVSTAASALGEPLEMNVASMPERGGRKCSQLHDKPSSGSTSPAPQAAPAGDDGSSRPTIWRATKKRRFPGSAVRRPPIRSRVSDGAGGPCASLRRRLSAGSGAEAGKEAAGARVATASRIGAPETAGMSHFENKRLLFGLMAGAAGVTFVLHWYLKMQKRSKGMHLPVFPNSASGFDLIDFPYETHQEEKTVLLLQGRQLQILEKLNGLVVSVEELKRELTFLKEAIPKLDELVRDELQGKTESHRTSPSHRSAKKRKTEAAAQGVSDTTSSEEAESEGSYMTAHTDTEGESEEEKGWINSSISSLTPEEKIDLSNLLQEADRMHGGSEHEKRESFKLLLEREEEYRNHPGFLWRLVRAYGDMFELTTDAEEKKNYAAEGKLVGENAVNLDPSSAESHQWFAIMCGYMSQFETIQNKIRNGYLFKEHLDQAIALKPRDPLLYYLTGRWCYEVAQLSWIEKKVAAALFGTPPTSTIHEALQNFLKAEEIHPRYSKCNYVYLAKCYKDLGQRSNALSCCETASSILPVTKEDQEAEKVLETLLPSLKL